METIEGSTLGNYVVDRFLGKGGFGQVYLAHHIKLPWQVCVKIIRPDRSDATGFTLFADLFDREARVLATLDHPHIVRLRDYGTRAEDALAYLVMDYVDGGDLSSLLRQVGGPLPLPQVLALVRQIGTGLDYAHGKGVLHRDLKPQNVLRYQDGRLVIADFGLAKAVETALSTSHLQQSVSAGTPAYMAPEHLRGEPEYRSDLYALGILTYELLAGRVPFQGDAMQVMYAQVNLPPPPLRPFNPQVSPLFEEVVLRMLSKAPAERYQSAQAFVTALQEALRENETVVPVPVPDAVQQPEEAATHPMPKQKSLTPESKTIVPVPAPVPVRPPEQTTRPPAPDTPFLSPPLPSVNSKKHESAGIAPPQPPLPTRPGRPVWQQPWVWLCALAVLFVIGGSGALVFSPLSPVHRQTLAALTPTAVPSTSASTPTPVLSAPTPIPSDSSSTSTPVPSDSASTPTSSLAGAEPTPTGVTDARILEPVAAQIKNCAHSAVAQPANCPQSSTEISSSASSIVWTLFGDPTQAAKVTPEGGSMFRVNGRLVMTLQWESYGKHQRVVTSSYIAQVDWSHDKATVISLAADKTDSPEAPLITRPAGATDKAALDATRAGFKDCRADPVGGPLACPFGKSFSSSDTNIQWTLLSDETQNARVTYDNTTGLVHVIGSFRTMVTYVSEYSGTQTEHQSGNYDALLAWQANHLTAVAIHEAS